VCSWFESPLPLPGRESTGGGGVVVGGGVVTGGGVTVGGGFEAGSRSGGAAGTGVEGVGAAGVGGPAAGVVGAGVGVGVGVGEGGVFGGVAGFGFGCVRGLGVAGVAAGFGATTAGPCAGAAVVGAGTRFVTAGGRETRTGTRWAFRLGGGGAPSGMTTTLPDPCPSGGAGSAIGGASCGFAAWRQRSAVPAIAATSARMAVARSIPVSLSPRRQTTH
jgi:hypothetical protein